MSFTIKLCSITLSFKISNNDKLRRQVQLYHVYKMVVNINRVMVVIILMLKSVESDLNNILLIII